MHPNPLKPFYRHAPIRNLDTLAEVLEVSRAPLDRLARNADRMYRPVPQKKKDGSERKTWDAYRQLKSVQQLIKIRILAQVSYPLYLQGGIRDRDNPRDYARNAAIHAGQACVINEDIADFFPSTTVEQVRDIWRHFFRFPEDVSECLAKLTTRRGVLPQGAKTSNHLANLTFWKTEHEFVRHLESQELRYSRLTDDITVSSTHPLSDAQKSRIMSAVYSFIKRNGYTPKYRKHYIYGHHERMLVNNLVVNKRPALTHRERQSIRSLVHKSARKLRNDDAADSGPSIARVRGKIGKLKRFHGPAGSLLATKLRVALSR